MRHILLRAKKEVFSNQIGLFSAQKGGEGYDFFDLEPYDYSSDAKRIHWPSYAKTRELYTKVFAKESRRNIQLISILSGSLYFGSKRLKFETLLETTALIAYSALAYKERLIINQTPLLNFYDLDHYLESLSQTQLLGKKAHFPYLKSDQKYLTIIIADFLDPIDLAPIAFKDDVVAIVIRDSLEKSRTLPYQADLLDTIRLEQTSANLAKSMSRYHKNIKLQLAHQYDQFKKLGVDWIELFEEDNVFTKLLHFFRSR